MAERSDLVAVMHASTTDVVGRFRLEGPGYELVADSALRGGGPGEAIGTLDLLIGSLVVCALNVLRKDRPDDADETGIAVECFARMLRAPDERGLGALALEFTVPADHAPATRSRITRFRERCRVYHALRDSIDVSFFVNGLGVRDRPAPQARQRADASTLRRLMEC